MNEWASEWESEWVNEWIDKLVSEWVSEWMIAWSDSSNPFTYVILSIHSLICTVPFYWIVIQILFGIEVYWLLSTFIFLNFLLSYQLWILILILFLGIFLSKCPSLQSVILREEQVQDPQLPTLRQRWTNAKSKR